MKTPLTVITEGKLELNKIIKDTLKVVLPALEKFQGKKISKTDASLMKSVESLKALMPTLKRADGSSYPIARINFQYNEIQIVFRICKSGGSYDVTPSTAYCEWFERSVCIGQTHNQVLVGVDNYNSIVSAYDLDKKPLNIDDQMTKVEEFKKLQKELHDLYYSIDSAIRDDQYIRIR